MNSAKLLLRIALLLAVSPALALSAQTPPAASTNAVATERFLVVVETSAAMQKRAENVQKALGSVISSGLSGHMVSGSTIGMWTFNDKLITGQFPLQLWTPPSRQRVAGAMVQFLQQQKYEKSARLAVVWAAVTNIVAHSEHITVLLITSGNNPLVGTPFDATINETFSKNTDVQRKQNMPFLTILRATRGNFVAFAVNMPPWPLEVPAYPDGFKPIPPLPPPAPRIVTNPAPAVIKRPDPAILSPTNTIVLKETSPPVTAPIQPPPPQPDSTNPVVAEPQVPPPPTNTPAPIPLPVKMEANPSPPAVAPVEKVSPPVVSTPDAEKRFPIVTFLVAGIALLLAVLIVFIALLRRSRRPTGASLITRSMNKDDQ